MYLYNFLLILIIACQQFREASLQSDDKSSDEFPDTSHTDSPNSDKHFKDKILMENVKSLTFFRNRKTTSRRTNSIHQLSCVGGTAGCKLFTPSVVECIKIGYDRNKVSHTWKCSADMSDRVKFNHVEVICEGYDYPEDDYILVGSCGLEFTLDYVDPLDYHEKSYLNHLDDHEKELHESIKAKKATKKNSDYISQVLSAPSQNFYYVGLFITSLTILYVIVRCFRVRNIVSGRHVIRPSVYGPITSTVFNTKKAC